MLASAVLLCASGCADGVTASAVPARVTKVAEPGGRVSAASAHSISVRVTDTGGGLVRGASVTWSVAAGGGAVTPTTAVTDASGQARAV